MRGPQPSRSMTQTGSYLYLYVLRLLARDSSSDRLGDFSGPLAAQRGLFWRARFSRIALESFLIAVPLASQNHVIDDSCTHLDEYR
jgi:hypothetical protein